MGTGGQKAVDKELNIFVKQVKFEVDALNQKKDQIILIVHSLLFDNQQQLIQIEIYIENSLNYSLADKDTLRNVLANYTKSIQDQENLIVKKLYTLHYTYLSTIQNAQQKLVSKVGGHRKNKSQEKVKIMSNFDIDDPESANLGLLEYGTILDSAKSRKYSLFQQIIDQYKNFNLNHNRDYINNLALLENTNLLMKIQLDLVVLQDGHFSEKVHEINSGLCDKYNQILAQISDLSIGKIKLQHECGSLFSIYLKNNKLLLIYIPEFKSGQPQQPQQQQTTSPLVAENQNVHITAYYYLLDIQYSEQNTKPIYNMDKIKKKVQAIIDRHKPKFSREYVQAIYRSCQCNLQIKESSLAIAIKQCQQQVEAFPLNDIYSLHQKQIRKRVNPSYAKAAKQTLMHDLSKFSFHEQDGSVSSNTQILDADPSESRAVSSLDINKKSML